MAVSRPTKAVVLGANGQDGSYLCEHAIQAGKSVLAIGRQSNARYPIDSDRYCYRQIDLCDDKALAQALVDFGPDEAYHLAAIHGSSGFAYESLWGKALDVNVKSLHAVLEQARTRNPNMRVVYASSAKVFGTPTTGNISIHSPKKQECLYSITKLAAERLIDYYYAEHGIISSIAYLFNHESLRRAGEFFFSRICAILARCAEDPSYRGTISNLNFYLDWGSAREFMQFFHEMTDFDEPQKLILATGEVLHAGTFVESLWSSYGLKAGNHIEETNPQQQATNFSIDLSHTQAVMGRIPSAKALDVATEMVEQMRREPRTK